MAEEVLELASMSDEEAAALGEALHLLWRAAQSVAVPTTLVIPTPLLDDARDRLPWNLELRLSRHFDAFGGHGAVVSIVEAGEWRGSPATFTAKKDLLRAMPAMWREHGASSDAVTLMSFIPPADATGGVRVPATEDHSSAPPGVDEGAWKAALEGWHSLAEAVGADLDIEWTYADDGLLVTRVSPAKPVSKPVALPPRGVAWSEVRDRLLAASEKDLRFRDGRILGSMCTAPLAEGIKAAGLFPEANLGNPGLCPGTAELEEEVIRMVASLLHGNGVYGQMISGSTEGNITALWMARNATGRREVLFPKSAHFSIDKACDLLDMVPVVVDLDEGYRMDIDDMRGKLSGNTAAVVALAGTTELGVVDPIEEIGESIGDDVFLHVDAAYGGFVLPFMRSLGREVPPFDFRVPQVTTITLDGHKMGMAPIPSSALLVRDGEMMRGIVHRSPYLTRLEHTAILGTRASMGVAGTYASLMTLGREGFVEIVGKTLEVTDRLADGVREMGLELAVEPETTILGILMRDPPAVRDAMTEKGWVLSLSRHPPCLRLVVMPHVNMKAADALLTDLEAVCRESGEL